MRWLAIITGCKAAPWLEMGKASLNPISQAIYDLIVGSRLLAATRWNHRFATWTPNQIYQLPAIVTLVASTHFALKPSSNAGIWVMSLR